MPTLDELKKDYQSLKNKNKEVSNTSLLDKLKSDYQRTANPTPEQQYQKAVQQAASIHGQAAPLAQQQLARKQQYINQQQTIANQKAEKEAQEKKIQDDYNDVMSRLKAGEKITDAEDIKKITRAKGISDEQVDYDLGRQEASKMPNAYKTEKGTYMNKHYSPETLYDVDYGKKAADKEFKSLDFTNSDNADKYYEYRTKLAEAQSKDDTANITKYTKLIEDFTKTFKEKHKDDEKKATAVKGTNPITGAVVPALLDYAKGNTRVLSAQAKADEWADAVNEDIEKYTTAQTEEKKKEISQKFQRDYEKLEQAKNNYYSALLYDELLNNNMAKDIATSFGTNVISGEANILNGMYAGSTKFAGIDATTINANALLDYVKGNTEGAGNAAKDIARSGLKGLNPITNLAANATGVFESANAAYNHLAYLAYINPNNQRLQNLYNNIKNRTYEGTADDLKAELDEIQKELYQGFKDRFTQDELDRAANQMRHNNAAYGKAAFIPNAFGTVGNMIPSILHGQALGGLAEFGGLGSMATAGSTANTLQQVGSLGTLGVGAMAQGMDEALQDGARYNQAFNYGVLTGATEAGTEVLGGETVNRAFGKAGRGVLGKLFGKAVDNLNIETKVGKVIAKTIGDVAAESTEEMISEAVNPLWKAITYNPDELPDSKEEIIQYVKDIFNAGIEAIPSTLLMQGAGVAGQVTKVNQIEQGMIDSVKNDKTMDIKAKNQLIEDIKEAAFDVKFNLTETKSNNINDAILEVMSNNTGEKSAKAVQALQNNNFDMSKAAQEVKELSDEAKAKAEATKISDDLIKQAEQIKQTEGMDVDKETLGGLQFMQNNREGLKVQLFAEKPKVDKDGKKTYNNGYYDEKTRTMYINAYAQNPIEITAVHELAHDLKAGNVADYQKLQDAVLKYAAKLPEYKDSLDALRKTYEESGAKFVLNDEATNDILAKAIGDREFLYSLNQAQPGTFERIYNWFKKVLFDADQTGLTFNQRRLLNKMKNNFRAIYQGEYKPTQQNNGTQASISEDVDINSETDYNKPYIDEKEGIYFDKNKGIQIEKNGILKDEVQYGDNLYEAIDSDTPKLRKNKLYSKHFGDYYFMFKKNAHNDYTVYSQIAIEGNEKLINELEKGMKRYVDKGTGSVIADIEALEYSRGNDNISNDNVAGFNTNNAASNLSKGEIETGQKTRSGRNIQQDNGNIDAQLENSNQSSFSMPKKDNKGRELSKEQQERYKDVSPKLRDENGNIKTYYHGTQRADRVGTLFDSSRATSGPMAFFTDNPEIATSYSKNKVDTSLAGEWDTEWDLFKANGMDLDRYWRNLSFEKRKEMREKGKDVGFNEDYELDFRPNGSRESFGTHYEDEMSRNGNNPLKALYDTFINGGYWIGEDIKNFKDILDYLGVENAEYADPYKTDSKVYETYLNIKNPFDTSEISEDILNQLKQRAKEVKYTEPDFAADLWDKRNISPEDWIEYLEEDIENGTTHSWTRIPDWVTDVLKENGYDGIVDTGGKHGGQEHQVVIPFYSNQIKDVENKTPTDNPDILLSKSNASWQQFLNKNFDWSKGTRTKFKKTDTNMMPTNQELQEFEKEQTNKIGETTPLSDIRSFKKAGERNVKAYQYENPEVKPFFQYEAKRLLEDLNNATKGERYATENEQGDLIWDGTKRSVVQDIADLLDGEYGVKLTYKDIKKGLEAIIKDNGAENIAAAKRIENVIDKRLREGYTDSYGYEHNPSENYNKFLNGKEYVEPEKYDYDKMVEQYGEPGQEEVKLLDTGDDTLFSLSSDIADFTDKLKKDTSLPDDVKKKLIEKLKNVKTTEQLKKVIREANNYKDMAYMQIEDNETPKKKVRWTKTAQNNELIRENVKEKDIEYVPSSNQRQIDHANKQLEQDGYEGSKSYLDGKVARGDRVNANDIALGERLIQEAIKKGNIREAQELIADVAIMGKDLGQAVQALSMISRMTPEGQLMYLQKVMNRLNEKIDTKNEKRNDKKKIDNIQLEEEYAQNILEAKDDVELQNAVNDALQRIADQMEVSFSDKVAEWRYLAMLANPRTHIRNIVANVGMKGLYGAKNQVQRALETLASPFLNERTRTFKKATSDVKAFAEQSTKDLADILGGNDNKTVEGRLKEMRKVFKNAALEKLRRFNSNMLSLEDNVFTQSAYKANLQEYLTANGIKTQKDIDMNPEIVQKGINWAKEEAWKTTFHQMSKLATAINRFENDGTLQRLFIGGTIPFKKTPINIAKTGAAYSPLGLLETVVGETYKLKTGQINANQYIDRLSQGLTGTAVFGIGAMLAKMGILKAGTDDDDEYAEAIGQTKQYSIRLGNKNYDISWFSPSAMPLLMGAELVGTTEGKKMNFDALYETLVSSINPLSEMSFVSSLNDTLKSYTNDNTPVDKIGGTIKNATRSYFGQFVPAVGGQINKIIDKTERNTTATKASKWKEGETFARQQLAKIPGGSFLLEPKTDVWGNEKKRSDNVLVRTFDALINPGTVTEDKTTDVDREIMSVMKEADDTSIRPQVPKNNFTYNKEEVDLTSKDYTTFKKIYGRYMFDLYDELFKSERYKELSPAEKAKIISQISKDAREVAKAKVGYETSDYMKYDVFRDELEKADIPLIDYYLVKRNITSTDGKGKKQTAIAQEVDLLNKAGEKITSEQKKVLRDIFGVD